MDEGPEHDYKWNDCGPVWCEITAMATSDQLSEFTRKERENLMERREEEVKKISVSVAEKKMKGVLATLISLARTEAP